MEYWYPKSKKEFGDLSYHSDGTLNRAYLADRVFGNETELEKLNRLVHPRVAVDYSRWRDHQKHAPYTLKEAALLFESGSYKTLERIIVVSAPEALRQKRVLQRDAHRTVEQFKGIVEKQMPEEQKLKRADYIIVNDDATLVIPQVLKLHTEFSKAVSS